MVLFGVSTKLDSESKQGVKGDIGELNLIPTLRELRQRYVLYGTAFASSPVTSSSKNQSFTHFSFFS